MTGKYRPGLGRLLRSLATGLVALIAVTFAVAVVAGPASAARQLDLEVREAWLRVDDFTRLATDLALYEGGALTEFTGLQVLDPEVEEPTTLGLSGLLGPDNRFTLSGRDFHFGSRVVPTGGLFESFFIELGTFQGRDLATVYDPISGTMSLSTNLTLDFGFRTRPTDVEPARDITCRIEPLPVTLTTQGEGEFGTAALPTDLSASPFEGGAEGSLFGRWEGQDRGLVSDIGSTPLNTCADLTSSFGDEFFSGMIWFQGAASVSEVPDPDPDPEPDPDPDPDPEPDPTVEPARIGRVTAPAKGKLKRGKATSVKVTVKNTGGKVFKGKLTIKSSNRQVKVPRSAGLNIKPGKTQIIKVRVKATKKARGKARISFTAGGRKALTTLTVRK